MGENISVRQKQGQKIKNVVEDALLNMAFPTCSHGGVLFCSVLNDQNSIFNNIQVYKGGKQNHK